MDISQIELSSDERRLFAEFSDSGMPLSLMLVEVRSYHPKLTEDQQLQIAKEILLSLVDKGLIALCKLTPENTTNHVYEVNEITSMSSLEIETVDFKEVVAFFKNYAAT